MCLIIAKPAGVAFDAEEIVSAAQCHPHGIGFAWTDGERIRRWRNLNDTALAVKQAEKLASYNAVAHFRYATHGAKTVDNIHPFFVDSRADIAVAHNGILDIESSDAVSDSRMFVSRFLRWMKNGWWTDPVTVGQMEALIGYSKIALLHLNGEFTILNEHLGSRDKTTGVWYSNTSHVYRCAPTRGYSAYSRDDDDAWYNVSPSKYGTSKYDNTPKRAASSAPSTPAATPPSAPPKLSTSADDTLMRTREASGDPVIGYALRNRSDEALVVLHGACLEDMERTWQTTLLWSDALSPTVLHQSHLDSFPTLRDARCEYCDGAMAVPVTLRSLPDLNDSDTVDELVGRFGYPEDEAEDEEDAQLEAYQTPPLVTAGDALDEAARAKAEREALGITAAEDARRKLASDSSRGIVSTPAYTPPARYEIHYSRR